jgi:hypothetical protein
MSTHGFQLGPLEPFEHALLGRHSGQGSGRDDCGAATRTSRRVRFSVRDSDLLLYLCP